MIKNEIIEEIIYKSNKQKIIDKLLLARIAIDEIDQADDIVKSNFSDIRFVKIKNNSSLAQAYKYKGIIEYDYKKSINSTLKKESDYLLINLKMIHYLLHEVEHLKELSKLNKCDFEANLLELSSEKYLYSLIVESLSKKYKSTRKIKKNSYKLFDDINLEKWTILPTEKIAELDSSKMLIKSLNSYPDFKNKYSESFKNIVCDYFDTLKMGYVYQEKKEKYNSPLVEYFKVLRELGDSITLENLGIPKEKYFDTLKKLSIENKMRYGLFITNEEMEKVEKQKKLIKSTL